MKIIMQEGKSPNELSCAVCDVSIVGEVVDDRGRAAIEFLRNNSKHVFTMKYDPDQFEVNVDGQVYNAEEIDLFLGPFEGGTIALKASTLGFVEIFLCSRVIQTFSLPKIKILYVEPLRYLNPRRTQLLHKRDFELSELIPGYRAIPGATFRLNDREPQRGVFFLGYEERRLDRALEDYQMIRPDRCCVVFGVPAFTPGWEMDAFANNIRVIRDKNIRGGVHFCGAENPAATIDLLQMIYESLDTAERERMFVAPIGTKPNGIGAALFAATHNDIGILYDHPRRRHDRSAETARWHLYQVDFKGSYSSA